MKSPWDVSVIKTSGEMDIKNVKYSVSNAIVCNEINRLIEAGCLRKINDLVLTKPQKWISKNLNSKLMQLC